MGYYEIVRSVPGGTVKKPKPKKPKRYKSMKLAAKLSTSPLLCPHIVITKKSTKIIKESPVS